MEDSSQRNINTTPVCTVQADSLSPTELWTLSIIKRQGFASLSWLSHLYHKAKDQTISPETARHYLYRVLHRLEAKGIVELQFDDHHLLTAKLKCVPVFYRSSPENVGKFDLSHLSKAPANLGFFASGGEKSGRLRVVHAKSLKGLKGLVRIQYGYRLSSQRRQALFEIAGMKYIVENSMIHEGLDYLFTEYEKRVRDSVVVLYDPITSEYLVLPARTRYTDPKILSEYYSRAERGLKLAFKQYHDAIFTTVTIPPILPLVVAVPELDAFILLQDSALSYVLRKLRDLVRRLWKDSDVDIRTFTAYEYHEDARLHGHVLILGIPYLFDWNKPMGRRKEPALTYLARKVGIDVTRNLRKRPSRLAKFILTRLLDKWLTEFLAKVDSALGTHFLDEYLAYKKAKGIDGPVNEVHQIRDGKWYKSKPSDARSPDAVRYILKYLLKMIRELQERALGLSKGVMKLKLLGYWIFAKRFYSHSRGLLGPPKKKKEKRGLRYIGTWRKIDLPDYIRPYAILSD